LVLPGAYDALTARLIERAGFNAIVVGGYSVVASHYAVPDIGLVGLSDMASAIRPVVGATALPVLVDGDNGYGDVKNVVRTIETYEAMGAGAILLEDQTSPKRCGHMEGKSVIAAGEMVHKLRAAVGARASRDFFIIARTDARSIYGLDDALRRGERYLAAGADGLFVEAPESVAELETIGKTFDVPLVCNMLVGGRTPIVPDAELGAMGFSMILHATDLIMSATNVATQALADLRAGRRVAAGHTGFDEFQDILDIQRWRNLDSQAPSDGAA
jgi:2-methylisocitrate lyase-like PEP mutase family enzyme